MQFSDELTVPFSTITWRYKFSFENGYILFYFQKNKISKNQRFLLLWNISELFQGSPQIQFNLNLKKKNEIKYHYSETNSMGSMERACEIQEKHKDPEMHDCTY